MITSKWIDRICVVAIIAALVLMTVVTCGRVSVEGSGTDLGTTMGYESRLFDTSRVHTIDIVMNDDDWDDLIANAQAEEYVSCAVVIDGESYKNVAIRAKGNTSLSQVSSMGSERYSFKIEFDHYVEGKTYYGLDKLCLNNIIQDSTYMKDYLTYTLMNEFGVDSPLCSYVYITVNGEDWGLYLAVEGVEDGFLERNYGSTGNLYKPDSMSFGGGRGNGADFDMNAFMEQIEGEGDSASDESVNARTGTGSDDARPDGSSADSGSSSGTDSGNNSRFDPSNGSGNNSSSDSGIDSINDSDNDSNNDSGNDEAVSDGQSSSAGNDSADRPQPPGGGQMPDFGNMPDFDNMPDLGEMTEAPSETTSDQRETADSTDAEGEDETDKDSSDERTDSKSAPDRSERAKGGAGFGGSGAGFGGFGGFGGMGSDDVKLKYTDDDPDSYTNIFDNAKTDIDDEDKSRLISSLKSLNEEEDLEDVVDIDEVIRYFVVHNFVCNGDSYTGAMIHNYYLYEKNGKLSMIPWDYNLAFGTFQASDDATSTVNSPIDTPVSGGSTDDRPMWDWIYDNEEYLEKYHEYFQEFLDSVNIEEIIDDTYNLIAPYVEKDPTAFYTYDEFETGVQALKTFCELRVQSIQGQLDGTIPSTTQGQSEDSSTLVDGSGLDLSDMGTQNQGQNDNSPGLSPNQGGPAPGNFDPFSGNDQSDSDEEADNSNIAS